MNFVNLIPAFCFRCSKIRKKGDVTTMWRRLLKNVLQLRFVSAGWPECCKKGVPHRALLEGKVLMPGEVLKIAAHCAFSV